MRISWKKNKNLKPDVILAKIDSVKTVSENNRVSYSFVGYKDAIAILINMVDFPRDCEGLDFERIVSTAVNIVATTCVLDKNKVMDEINNIVKQENATAESEFHLLTSISLAHPYPLNDIIIESANIRMLNSDYPKKYTGRNKLINKHSNILKSPKNYAKVIVSIKERSVRRAATKSLRALDILRAIWCMFSNPAMEIFGEQWRPINNIRLGSAHTLHKDTGEPATDDIWYEPNFSPASIFKSNKIDVLSKNCKWALEKLELIPYSLTVKDSLLRYVRALDEKDQNTALIRLWGAVETLAAPGRVIMI